MGNIFNKKIWKRPLFISTNVVPKVMGTSSNPKFSILDYFSVRVSLSQVIRTGLLAKCSGLTNKDKWVLSSDGFVLVLSETCLIDSVSSSECFNDRYIVWRSDRDYVLTGQSRGGGILIATRRDLPVSTQPLLNSTTENLWIKIRIKKHSLRVYTNLYLCVLYLCKQHKGLSFSSQLKYFLTKLNQLVTNNISDTVFILGDFNMSGVQWLSSNDDMLIPSNLSSKDEYLKKKNKNNNP